MTPQEMARSTVTISCLSLLLDVAAARGLPRERMLEGIDLPLQWLERPDARIPLMNYIFIFDRVRRACDDAGVGLAVGHGCKLTSHGFLGLGVMSQPTLRAATAFVERYFVKLCFPLCAGVFREEDSHGVVDLHSTIADAQTQRYTVDIALSGLLRILQHFVPSAEIEAWFAGVEPPEFDRYRGQFSVVRFNTGVNQLRFPARWLDRPNEGACAMTARLVTAQCDREIAALHATDDLLGRCRVLLARCNGYYPSLDEMAQQLCMSGRTLKRKLSLHGQTFMGLLDEARYGESVRLLKTTTLTIDQIAERLGYSAHGNFSRAFRGWAGIPPGAFRAGAAEPAAAAAPREHLFSAGGWSAAASLA